MKYRRRLRRRRGKPGTNPARSGSDVVRVERRPPPVPTDLDGILREIVEVAAKASIQRRRGWKQLAQTIARLAKLAHALPIAPLRGGAGVAGEEALAMVRRTANEARIRIAAGDAPPGSEERDDLLRRVAAYANAAAATALLR